MTQILYCSGCVDRRKIKISFSSSYFFLTNENGTEIFLCTTIMTRVHFALLSSFPLVQNLFPCVTFVLSSSLGVAFFYRDAFFLTFNFLC